MENCYNLNFINICMFYHIIYVHFAIKLILNISQIFEMVINFYNFFKGKLLQVYFNFINIHMRCNIIYAHLVIIKKDPTIF